MQMDEVLSIVADPGLIVPVPLGRLFVLARPSDSRDQCPEALALKGHQHSRQSDHAE
jgi:hypothetical protein